MSREVICEFSLNHCVFEGQPAENLQQIFERTFVNFTVAKLKTQV